MQLAFAGILQIYKLILILMINSVVIEGKYIMYITVYVENISSRFNRNSEANASEFLENLEEIFLR